MQQTAITIAPSTNTELSAILSTLHSSLENAAQHAVDAETQGQQWTALEKRAMVQVRKLSMLNGFDLATILERGQTLHTIDQEGLVGVFPGDYTSLEMIAGDVGISVAELSDTRALCDVIFPWLEANSGKAVAEWWDQVGKSKFREMVPVLRALISGAATTDRASVREAVENILNSVQATAQAAGQEPLSVDEARFQGVLNVLEAGRLPVREMRQQIRPNRTPNIPGVRFTNPDGINFVVLKITPDQQLMLTRLLGTHVDMVSVPANEHHRITDELETLRL